MDDVQGHEVLYIPGVMTPTEVKNLVLSLQLWLIRLIVLKWLFLLYKDASLPSLDSCLCDVSLEGYIHSTFFFFSVFQLRFREFSQFFYIRQNHLTFNSKICRYCLHMMLVPKLSRWVLSSRNFYCWFGCWS